MYEELKQAWSTLTGPGGQFEIVETEVRGQKLREYKNAPPTVRALWGLTAAHGDKEYLVYGDERWTYADAHRDVASIANWLLANGVEKGDRVAIAMRNYPEWMLSYWACTSIGVAAVGVNAWWTGPELVYGIGDSDPKVVIADDERLDRMQQHRDEIGDRLLVGVRLAEARDGVVSLADVCAHGGELPDVEVHPDDDACIFYTSGTTGKPKGAQLTHRGCTNNLMSMAFSNTVQPMALAAAGLPPSPDEGPPAPPAALVVTPLFHVTANNCVAHTITAVGGKLVHMYKWDAAEALRLIEAEKITAMSGVPVMARELIAHPDFAKRDTSTLKTLAGGGAQVQPDLVQKIDDSVKTARPGTGYGMTETCGIITSLSADFFVDRPESAGPAMPSYETRVIDADGNELPHGETGELCVRGAQVIKGYLNRPEATAETIEDGWLRTGDIGYLDEDGFIYIVDRAKDMVLRGGENIYCAEVEAAIFANDAVAECTVFGVPDDRLGEEVGAAIVTSAPLDADALRGFLKERIAGFKVPRYIWFMEEALPRNASGKFLKRELRDRLDPADAV
ncbi:MAG: class I adenylate-forming enzyme family protein [Myxococcota bacterium]|jgi:long-chain acyl-CoA synthetase|nr:class I adenylate-forming enzyme family protein [Myxococcota bacterium]